MKRLLLLFTCALLYSYTLFSQVPPNDLIENATLISSLPSSDLNVLLGNATTSTAGEIDCEVSTSYPTVFYKFTADVSQTVNILLEDADGGSITPSTSFAIVYSAPTLNASSPAELSWVTNCSFGTETTFLAASGVNYYVVVYRDTSSGLNTNIYFDAGSNEVPASELDALIAFYNATGGDSWTNNTNWNTVAPVSSWYGITVTNGRVSQISLSYNNLSGSIPESIGNMAELIYLDLQVNNLTGEIPNNIGNLSQLYYLRLNTNQLTGTIPLELYTLTNLQYLILAVNNLTGPIAPEIGNLTNLFELSISDNSFGGSIPSEIGNLLNLGYLSLSSCSLSGTIPTEIGSLTNLTTIFLYFNNLSGSIPNSFQNLINLQNLQVSNNLLTGDIPDFTGFVNLNYLNFSNNYFQFGDFENEFSQYQSNIIEFLYSPQLSPNLGVNTITLDIGDNSTLNSEPISGTNNLYKWYLNGQLITSATNPDYVINDFQLNESGTYECLVSNTIVTGLSISAGIFEVGLNPTLHPDYNALVALYNATNGPNWFNNTNWLDPTKPINTWYGVLTLDGTGSSRVTTINLNSNNLNGIIPDEIGNLTNLFNFYLDNNYLTGALPLTISNLTLMSGFRVINNNLAGELPDISNITDLSFINIQNNKYIFADLESQYVNYNNKMGANFIYAPQQLIDVAYGVVTNIGASTTLNTLTGLGSNLVIDWYKIDNLGNYVYLASGPTYDLTINTITDYGNYIYYVTSPTLTALGLESKPITVGPDPSTHPDYNALIAIYNALDGPNWTNPWDITAPINTWDQSFGLGFDSATDRVNLVSLNGRNLTGTIPTEIGNLTELETLELLGNNISGELPAEIWTLTNLKNLFLGSNPISLTGGIPSQISNLQNLEWFNVSGIPLSQPLQAELFNLPNLIRLRIANCGLIGTLPPELALINDVRAGGNEFEGAIPLEILNSTGNYRLNIQDNYLDFSDLEPLLAANNYSILSYSPQRTKDIAQEVQSVPGQDIVLNVDDTDINRVSAAVAGNEYQWFKDDVIISGANANSFTIFNAQEIDSGIYYCEITNSLVPDLIIRRANITVTIDGTLTINENMIDDVVIYPNPVKETFNIKLNNFQNASATLYDLRGRLILNQKLDSELTTVNISNLNNGIYVLNVENKTGKVTKRIIKK